MNEATSFFGYPAVWNQAEKKVTLGDSYFFKVHDDHWTEKEKKLRSNVIGKWTVHASNASDHTLESHGTLEIREHGTMLWDVLVS